MIKYFIGVYSIEKYNGKWNIYKNEPYLKSTVYTNLFYPVGPFDSFIHAVKELKSLIANKEI